MPALQLLLQVGEGCGWVQAFVCSRVCTSVHKRARVHVHDHVPYPSLTPAAAVPSPCSNVCQWTAAAAAARLQHRQRGSSGS
jgi:hypothetical protein